MGGVGGIKINKIIEREIIMKDKVKQIIAENIYMTISVASTKGNPWVANLYFACDKKYNFYWYSPTDSIHSKYIRENPQVAISIFDSTAIGDNVDAVYIKANAVEVTNKIEIVKGLTIYGKKMLETGFANSKAQVEKFIKQYKDFQGASKIHMYKAVPEKVWKLAPSEMFNDKFVDSRIEVNLLDQ